MHNLVDNQARARNISTTTNNWLLYFTVENAWENIDGKYLFRFETAKSTLAFHFTSHSQSDENKVKVFIRSVIVVVVVAVDVFSFPFGTEKKI